MPLTEAEGFAADPSYMPWGHTNPTYSVRDDVGKALGKHTLQLGAQYVYSQRNQTNNAIGAASGDMQGLLTYSNLTNSTGNAFADFLLKTTPTRHQSARIHTELYPGFREGPILPALPESPSLISRTTGR